MDNIGTGGILGIGIGGLALLILLAGVVGYLYSLRNPAYPIGPPTSRISESLSLAIATKAMFYFIPYSLFLFGVISDIVNTEVRFVPSGVIGVIAIYLNSLISYFVKKDVTKDTDICGIPGMTLSGSSIAPQNILFSTTVSSYIAANLITRDASAKNMGIGIGSVFLLFIIQLGMYYSNKCFVPGRWAGSAYSIFPPLYSLIAGGLVGGVSGWAITNALPSPQSKNNQPSTILISEEPATAPASSGAASGSGSGAASGSGSGTASGTASSSGSGTASGSGSSSGTASGTSGGAASSSGSSGSGSGGSGTTSTVALV